MDSIAKSRRTQRTWGVLLGLTLVVAGCTSRLASVARPDDLRATFLRLYERADELANTPITTLPFPDNANRLAWAKSQYLYCSALTATDRAKRGIQPVCDDAKHDLDAWYRYGL